MFGWKKYRFRFEGAGVGIGGCNWQTIGGKFIQYLVPSAINYIPELSALKPGESVEVEIRIKGRK
jgi:hypothetical protein